MERGSRQGKSAYFGEPNLFGFEENKELAVLAAAVLKLQH